MFFILTINIYTFDKRIQKLPKHNIANRSAVRLVAYQI